jgi:hypothetical protein
MKMQLHVCTYRISISRSHKLPLHHGSTFYSTASSPTIATPSPRPAPADWKGAAAVLAAAAALPEAEAEAEAEADDADDAEAEPDAAEAEADAEAEAEAEPEGQVGDVSSSTPEPLHSAVAREIVSARPLSAARCDQSARARVCVLTVLVGLVAGAEDTAGYAGDGAALADAADISKAAGSNVVAEAVLLGEFSGCWLGVAMATYGTLGQRALEPLRHDGSAECSNGSEDGQLHGGGGAVQCRTLSG